MSDCLYVYVLRFQHVTSNCADDSITKCQETNSHYCQRSAMLMDFCWLLVSLFQVLTRCSNPLISHCLVILLTSCVLPAPCYSLTVPGSAIVFVFFVTHALSKKYKHGCPTSQVISTHFTGTLLESRHTVNSERH